MQNSVTQGVDHVGLSVRDLDASLSFFTKVLGWEKFGGNDEYPSAYITDGHAKITLWACNADDVREFDRHANIGLHHLAIKVSSSETLNTLFDAVKDWPGVEVEFSPEFSGNGPKEHFMVREPGGTRLEIAFDPR